MPKLEIERFMMLSEHRLSRNTIDLYRHYLALFEAEIPDNDPQSITAVQIINWIHSHLEWSSSTQNNACSAVRAYYRWCYGDLHPVMAARVRRVAPGPQQTLDWEGLAKLMQSIDTSRVKGIRDLALVTMLVDTGLRSAEIRSMQLKHLNLKRREVWTIIKGGHWASARYFDYTASCLESWLRVRADLARPDVGNVFVSVGGGKKGQPMTGGGLRKLFAELGVQADLDVTRLNVHTMRRTFATLSIEAGAPTRTVQMAGRWKNLEMVERYTQALQQEALHPWSPVNRVMGYNPTNNEYTPDVGDNQPA